MIDITVENIKEELHPYIHNIMSDFQIAEGITNRYFSKIQKVYLDTKIEELATTMWIILNKQSENK